MGRDFRSEINTLTCYFAKYLSIIYLYLPTYLPTDLPIIYIYLSMKNYLNLINEIINK